MAEITELKKHIINYVNTKEVYTAYKESGYSTKYYTVNAKNILIHQSAKQAFDLLSKEQIPTIKTLQNKCQECLSKKNSLLTDYKSANPPLNYDSDSRSKKLNPLWLYIIPSLTEVLGFYLQCQYPCHFVR